MIKINVHFFLQISHYLLADNEASVAFVDDFSIECWVNLDATVPAQHHFAVEISDTGVNRIGLCARRNAGGNYIALLSSLGGGAWSSTSTTLAAGSWAHLVASIDVGNTVSFYLNGVPIGTPAFGALPVFGAATTDVYIGTGSLTAYYKGLIGDVRLYSGTMTAVQALQNFNATKAKYTTGSIYTSSTLASVIDNANDYVIGDPDATPYIESFSFTKGGVPRCFVDWEYAAIFTDSTGNGNDATPVFRTTSSDADVTAELISFGPISQAIADNITAGGDNPMATDVPAEPEDMWGPTGEIGLFFAGPINSILDKTGIPQQAFWYPVVFVFIYLVGMAMYKIKSTLFKAIIIGVVMFFFARVNVYGDYIMIFYVCDVYGIVIMSKHFGW